MSHDADDFLGGGGTPWISFKNALNVRKGGKIIEAPKQQQMRDYDDPSILLFWDDAKTQPRMELVVKVQTDERREDVEGDTGIRAFHLSSKGHKDALREAIRVSGAPGLRVGGELYLTWVAGGKEGPGTKKADRAKIYKGEYTAPDEASEFLATPEVETAPAAPASDSLTSATLAPAGKPVLTPEQRQQLVQAGINPDTMQPLAQ